MGLENVVAGTELSFKKDTKQNALASLDAGRVFMTQDTHEIIVAGQSFGQDPAVLYGTPEDIYVSGAATVWGALNKAIAAYNLADSKVGLVNGKIPADLLPGFVDDVIDVVGCYEYNLELYRPLENGKLKQNPTSADFVAANKISPTGSPGTLYMAIDHDVQSNDPGLYHYESGLTWEPRERGEAGKIYVETSTSMEYRFAANSYTPIPIHKGTIYTDDDAKKAIFPSNTNDKISHLRNLVAAYEGGNLTGGGSVVPVTSWSQTPSDSNIPSEKLVADTLNAISARLTWQ